MQDFTCDIAIFGAGAAGLWTTDHLRRAGYRVITLEAHAPGTPQTLGSQGIIHGGLKYTLDGLINPSARAIREMPDLWRRCLKGEIEPRLTRTRLRAEFCHLWRTDDFMSRLAMVGATRGLQVTPTRLPREQWPTALRDCPGEVFRLDEPVICPQSLVADLLTRNRSAGPIVYAPESLETQRADDALTLRFDTADRKCRLAARLVVLAAGAGNDELRKRFGLPAGRMQLRPLHMTLVRGRLPELNGHCVDHAHTRVTVTSATDSAGQVVWQVGGQVAEDGVRMPSDDLTRHVRSELRACLPGIDLHEAEWATYRIDRAEARAGGKRPNTESVEQQDGVITAWPTKLALAPRLAERVALMVGERIGPPTAGGRDPFEIPESITAPAPGRPPWEEQAWRRDL